MPIATLLRTITCHGISVKMLFFDAKVLFLKTFNPGNNLKWNYEALALHIKVKSNKKTPPTNLQWLFEVACILPLI